MEVIKAIHDRRTVRMFTEKPLNDDVLNKILEAGIWAPSHGNTQPWEFIVIGPNTRRKLSETYLNMMENGPLKNPSFPEDRKAAIRKFATNFGDAPVLIAVACPPASNDMDRYDFPLTAGAVIQNMLLEAWDNEVAGVWLSFGINPEAQSILEINEGGFIGGILAIGYSSNIPAAPPRISVEEKTRKLP
ncbi:nitroreductase family protein [Clostridium swellfunianum]|uniref:nitroreductase family protein n=1 Tax=Clostridium swellfunianum TaxID=1367462 RepID=UPI00202FB1D2|nr:nitroreductase family protein [Clostridium swellfunianum]MCM0650668.1 nitroreductase family protein [Clostridium swellfunianum]